MSAASQVWPALFLPSLRRAKLSTVFAYSCQGCEAQQIIQVCENFLVAACANLVMMIMPEAAGPYAPWHHALQHPWEVQPTMQLCDQVGQNNIIAQP